MPKDELQIIYSYNSTNFLQCLYCQSEFVPKRKDAKFCCRDHKDKHQQLQRKELRRKTCRKTPKEKLRIKFNKLVKSSFGLWLSSAIKRAGTVEIFTDFTSQTLHVLHSLKKRATAYSGYDNGVPTGYYQLSHIFSVKGNSSSLGTIHPENLVITPKEWNYKNSTTALEGTGRSIKRLELKSRWRVSSSNTPSEVLGKLKAYLGKEFNKFLVSVQINKSQVDQLSDKLKAITSIPENSNLNKLKELAILNNIKVFNSISLPAPEHHVLKAEFERLGLQSNWSYWIVNQIVMSENTGSVSLAELEKSTPADYFKFVCDQAYSCLHAKKMKFLFDGKPATDYYKLPAWVYSLDAIERPMSPLEIHLLVMGINRN
ncbi:MAG: hypothetical protein ACKO0Z_00890 [Betaproteobacteria bacterium]